MELMYDPSAQEQKLLFNFAMHVSVPQLLKEIMKLQSAEGPAPPSRTGNEVLRQVELSQKHEAFIPSQQRVEFQAQSSLNASVSSVHRVDFQTQPAPASVTSVSSMQRMDFQTQPALPASVSSMQRVEFQTVAAPASVSSVQRADSRTTTPASVSSMQRADLQRQAAPALNVMPLALTPTSASNSSKAPVPVPPSASRALTVPTQSQMTPANKEESSESVGNVMAFEKLHQAVLQGSAEDARLALIEGADVNSAVAGPRGGSFLHSAIQRGRIDIVNVLIQARCDPNTPATDGKTPLHLAISYCAIVPPIVSKLLILTKARLEATDAANMTPIDCMKQMISHGKSKRGVMPTGASELIDEMANHPTVAIHVENEPVNGAMFADMENDKIVFFTDTSVGLYSLRRGEIIASRKLTQLLVQSVVRDVTVNPCVGTIAVFLEVFGRPSQGDGTTMQDLIIVWPTGQLHEEEPLKLSACSDSVHSGNTMPPCFASSTSLGPLTLVSRVCCGRVLCWRLNTACSQVVFEAMICTHGGLIAISGTGWWLAVVDRAIAGGEKVVVWRFNGENSNALQLQQVTTVDRAPESMSTIEVNEGLNGSSCRLALVDPSGHGRTAVIEVLDIQADGSCSTTHRLMQPHPCRSLAFGHQSPNHMVALDSAGGIFTFALQRDAYATACDDPDASAMCLSVDSELMITAVASCFRVFRAPRPQ